MGVGVTIAKDVNQARIMYHPSSEANEELLYRFAYQKYRTLKAAEDDEQDYEQENASLLGSCLLCSVITKIH